MHEGSSSERRRAADKLIALMMRPLHALCVNILNNQADADDALQEALVAIYSGIARFRGESRIMTWAYRITVRVAMRRAINRKKRSETALPDEHAGHDKAAAENRMMAKQALSALAALPEKHRVVIALFAVEGLTHPEIADILGIAEGTVWSRLHSARGKLRELMKHGTGA